MGKKVNWGSLLNSRIAANDKLRELYSRVEGLKPIDAGHNFDHTLRVAKYTAQIFSDEVQTRFGRSAHAEELDACFAAAILHDCVPVPKDSPLRKESSRLSSETARTWLNELSWNASQIDSIVNAVQDHSYSAGRTPKDLLGEALQDGDRLESLGALGLYRTIATGVAMGAELFNAKDPFAKERVLDDKKYSLDHFYTKLLKLPEGFKTQTAKREAHLRAEFLERFADQLSKEIES